MKFDRKASGEGIEVICCRLENGRAMLEWKFSFTEEPEDTGNMQKERTVGNLVRSGPKEQWTVRLLLTDMRGNMVLEGMQPVWEEEPLCSVLLQPRLWRGVEEPCLYHLEAILEDGAGNAQDQISRLLPLRTCSCVDQGRMFSLNGERIERRAVFYMPPSAVSEAECQRLVTEDFRQILRMGANCIYTEGREELRKLFLHLCDRMGLLLFYREKGKMAYTNPGGDIEIQIPGGETIPLFYGEKECLFLKDSRMPTSLYYRYLAKWSEEPFVYIIPESVKKLESGNYTVRCYSSCGRIALYSDGTLFEFQRGEEEFTFLEVPVKTPCIMLTAEGDGCSASLSLSRRVCNSLSKSIELSGVL